MRPEYEIERELQRAATAKQIVSEPLYIEAWDTLRASYVEALVATPINDEKQKTQLQIAIRVLDGLKNTFSGFMQTGAAAVHEIELRKKTMRERASDLWPIR